MNTTTTSTPTNPITMDVEQLHVILQQSFASEASVRNPAEEIIRHLKHIQGATVLLLQVVSEKQVRIAYMSYICALTVDILYIIHTYIHIYI